MKKKTITIKKTKIFSELTESYQKILSFVPTNEEEQKSKDEIITVIVYLINEYFENKGKPFSSDKFFVAKNLIEDIKKLA